MKKLLLLTATALFAVQSGFAQTPNRKCATVEVRERSIARDPSIIKRIEEIEAFTQQYVQSNQNRDKRSAGTIITIPVVVHVIHNGEAVGTGANISDAQVLSQITALNEDFRLLNPDSLDDNHPFWPYTADTEIEFCMAKQDENGLPTTGIMRYIGAKTAWEADEFDAVVKPQTIWNRHKYLNMWTTEFTGVDETTLGYAISPAYATDSDDGLVMAYDKFGTVGNVTAPFDLGRTVTHEVGHWLNLEHIWGDDVCGDDLVADTEIAEQDNYGCSTFPHNANSTCGSGADGEMYMNYMDYSDDACLVMFTYGQSLRMQATLNGPRSSLLTSKGCQTSTVSIAEENISASINVFPNPAKEKLEITLPSNMENINISVKNYSGQTVMQKTNIEKGLNHYSIDVSSLPNGFYLLQIGNTKGSSIKKFTIIR